MIHGVQHDTHDWWLEVATTETWAYHHELFNDEEIDQINKIASGYILDQGEVGSGKDKAKNTNIRNSNIAFLRSSDDANNWIFERITRAVMGINHQFWNFDLTRIETLQYSEYNVGQFYKDHIDMMYQSPNRAVRKLSFTVQLTDPKKYKGGDVIIKSGVDDLPMYKNKGTILFFPSYMLHEVTPVTKGTRHALVGWVSGPPFK